MMEAEKIRKGKETKLVEPKDLEILDSFTTLFKTFRDDGKAHLDLSLSCQIECDVDDLLEANSLQYVEDRSERSTLPA